MRKFLSSIFVYTPTIFTAKQFGHFVTGYITLCLYQDWETFCESLTKYERVSLIIQNINKTCFM